MKEYNLDDLADLLSEATGSKRKGVYDFIQNSQDLMKAQAAQKEARIAEATSALRPNISTGSNVDIDTEEVKQLKNTVKSQTEDYANSRKRASMGLKELLDEYKSAIYDNKPGILHKINRALQQFSYGYSGGDKKILPALTKQWEQNQDRMITAGKAVDTGSRYSAIEDRLRRKDNDIAKNNADKLNTQLRIKLQEQILKAKQAGDVNALRALEFQAKSFIGQESEEAKMASLALKAAQNPMTAPMVMNEDQLKQSQKSVLDYTTSKTIPGVVGKAMSEKTPGGIINIPKYLEITKPNGDKARELFPNLTRGPAGPSLGSQMVNQGVNIGDKFRSMVGQMSGQGLAPPQASPPQPQPQPQTPSPAQLPTQPARPQMLPTKPQVPAMQGRSQVNPFLDSSTVISQEDRAKGRKLFIGGDLPGENYTIVRPIQNPTADALGKQFGLPGSISSGPGTKDAIDRRENQDKFISTGTKVIVDLTGALATPSKKYPNKTIADVVIGGPGNQPKGDFMGNLSDPSVPNRAPTLAKIAGSVRTLIGSKSASQTAQHIKNVTDDFNTLLGTHAEDPDAQRFATTFSQGISQLLSFYTKSITGSQVNQTELEQFASVIPNMLQSPQTALTLLMEFNTRASIIGTLRNAGYDDSAVYRFMSNPQVMQELKNYSGSYINDAIGARTKISARPGIKSPSADVSRLSPVNIIGHLSEKFGQLGGIEVKRVVRGVGGSKNGPVSPISPFKSPNRSSDIRKLFGIEEK